MASSSSSSAMAKPPEDKTLDDDDDQTLLTIAGYQSSLLLSAASAASDLDLAFRLQLQEALSASLLTNPAPEQHAAVITDDSDGDGEEYVMRLQAEELERFCKERKDREMQQVEMGRVKCGLKLREYDERFAKEIEDMDDEDWDEFGDNYEKPVDPQNPNPLLSDLEEEEKPFNIYFKGLSTTEIFNGSPAQLAGIGIAICDPKNNLILKIQKPAQAVSRQILECKALIEALNAALSLGIGSVNVYFDFKVLYNYVAGLWTPKQKKILNLIDQISLLQRKFKKCKLFLLPRCHIHFVFRLARDVIDSQLTKTDQSESSNTKGHTETCHICLEPTDQMFDIKPCMHRFCISCLKQHVEVKLLHGQLPICPSEKCEVKLTLQDSEKFLTPKLLRIMSERIKEESIPAQNKVYCPNPRCSFLMSLNEVIKPNYPLNSVNYASSSKGSGVRKCVKCEGLFCVNCKVVWHEGMSCYEYKMRNPNLRQDDYKLHLLARKSMWKQCEKCKHMIELAEGCFHMTCKCGYEFCYTCGKEWKNKKATCTCPLWDENYILHDDSEEEDEEDLYEDDSDDDYYNHNNNNNHNNNRGFVNQHYRLRPYYYQPF